MKNWKLAAALAGLMCAGASHALLVGDIAFIGFNADGTDGYSFVALNNIAGSEVIRFTDDEWNGSGWVDANEAEWTWTAPVSGVTAGSVINVVDINNLYSGSPVTSANVGSIAAVSDANNNPGFSTTSDTVYAYTGTRASGTLIAAISSDTAVNFGGLTGASAIALASSSDGAKYVGARSGQSLFSGYKPLIANVAGNWTDVGNGTGDNNFSSTPFTIVPEPSSFVALALAGTLAIRRRGRK